ncbi:MAG: hypothetical protein AAFR34_09120 [Pseudomonadota bacterium]
MGQLEAVNLLKRISIQKIKSRAVVTQRRDATDKRALPSLSREYMDAMFDQSERVSAKRGEAT